MLSLFIKWFHLLFYFILFYFWTVINYSIKGQHRNRLFRHFSYFRTAFIWILTFNILLCHLLIDWGRNKTEKQISITSFGVSREGRKWIPKWYHFAFQANLASIVQMYIEGNLIFKLIVCIVDVSLKSKSISKSIKCVMNADEAIEYWIHHYTH